LKRRPPFEAAFFFEEQESKDGRLGGCDQKVTSSFNVRYDLPFGRGRVFGSNINCAADLVAGGGG
jgi:hypothetical protein